MSDVSDQRTDHLLILRGLCALGVLLHHTTGQAWLFTNGWDLRTPLEHSRFGALAMRVLWPPTAETFVLVFFVLSGYLMGKVFVSGRYELTRSGLRSFYTRRFLRVAPLLYVNLFVLVALTGVWNNVYYRPVAALSDVLFLNNLSASVINPVTWSISYEMQDYLICPAFFLLFGKYSRRNLLPIAITIVVLAGLSQAAHSHDDIVVLRLFQFTWLFLTGFLVNYLILLGRGFSLGGGRLARAVGYCCFTAAILGHWYWFKSGHFFAARVTVCAFSAAAIWWLESAIRTERRETRACDCPPDMARANFLRCVSLALSDPHRLVGHELQRAR